MGQSIFESAPEFAGAKEGAQVGTVVVGSNGGASPNEENSTDGSLLSHSDAVSAEPVDRSNRP